MSFQERLAQARQAVTKSRNEKAQELESHEQERERLTIEEETRRQNAILAINEQLQNDPRYKAIERALKDPDIIAASKEILRIFSADVAFRGNRKYRKEHTYIKTKLPTAWWEFNGIDQLLNEGGTIIIQGGNHYIHEGDHVGDSSNVVLTPYLIPNSATLHVFMLNSRENFPHYVLRTNHIIGEANNNISASNLTQGLPDYLARGEFDRYSIKLESAPVGTLEEFIDILVQFCQES